MEQDNLAQECFAIVAQMTRMRSPAEGEVRTMHRELCGYLDRLLGDPVALGLDPSQANDIAYAIIALADEVALGAGGTMAQVWMPRMLQLHYFNETVAGEGFFQRLEILQETTGQRIVLQAYYMALALGFQGRYGVSHGGDAIARIMDTLKQTLTQALVNQHQGLSPRAGVALPASEPTQHPWRVPLAWSAAVWITWGVCVAGMHGYLQAQSHAVVQSIACAQQVHP